jgi:hypothetical protein
MAKLYQRLKEFLRWDTIYVEVYTLLESRDASTLELWKQTALPEADVLSVLGVIREVYDYPNNHMAPDDPVAIILNEGFHELAVQNVVNQLNAKYQVSQTVAELNTLGTMQDLVQWVVAAVASKASA